MVKNTLATVALVASFAGALPPLASAADSGRQVQVERKSESVMPFSIDATMHTFVPTRTGGVQTVMVHNGDAKQVLLVRSHLRKEARAFSHGDFADPASIHGDTMPGLQAIRAGALQISIGYSEVPNGAAISYTTGDSKLISAIHAWFKAQVSDHGSHATMKM